MASTHAIISRNVTILLFGFLVFVAMANADDESDALLRLKVSFNNAGVLQSWVPGSNPCDEKEQWEGVRCSDGHVYFIRLEGLNLSNTIDVDALLQIPMLRTVSFTSNTFSGRIPAMNKLVGLRALYLADNQFSGEIPGDFFTEMKYLKKLWLSSNRFSGPIPTSLDKVPLMELHLENNSFSGSIPELNLESIADFSVANNNLTGPIPKGLLRFDEKTFEGNPGLCGEKAGKPCDEQTSEKPKEGSKGSAPKQSEDQNSDGKDMYKMMSIWFMVACGVILAIMIAGIVFLWRKQKREAELPKENADVFDDEFGRPMDKEHVNMVSDMDHSGRMMTAEKENVNVVTDMNQSARMMPAEQKNVNHVVDEMNGSGAMLAVAKDPRASGVSMEVSDLVMVNDDKGKFGLPDLMKASAEVLGNGTMGSSYKATISNGLTVVVKRIKETNTIDRDAFDDQIRRLGGIRHKNVLMPLAYHYRAEEKLLITEYMPRGSLLYLLHGDRGSPNRELKWPVRLRIIQGIARGLFYIHTELSQLEVPHGDLKSSNVLLSNEYEPLLSDYGFCNLITRTQASQALSAYKSPEALNNGKVSPKCDVYCMGVIILELLTGKYPSQYLNSGKGGTDIVQWARSAISEGTEVELFDKDITSSASFLPKIKEFLHIGVACTEREPVKRLDIREAISRIEAFHSSSGPDESSRLTQSVSFGLL
ncbi:hypothetical protein Leryth_012596 [Lithospermum erythrorhizon]|nr:hypothetical protein Leryth_012596 [Lithospermum erythrorhizon]